jgi:hypothetical protein
MDAAEIEEAITTLVELNGERSVEIRALERLVIALACIGVDQADDPTAFTEKLRDVALEVFERSADPRGDPLRERAELLLGKIERWGARANR